MRVALAIGRAIGGAVAWLIERPSRAIAAVLLVALAAHHLAIDPRLRRQRDAALGAVQILAARAVAEKRAHRQTKQAYRAAQAEAARLDRERVARVKAEQQEITDDVVADYRLRLADARARAERLRGELAGAGERAAGAGGAEPVPGAGDAAGGADGAAADHRLPGSLSGPTARSGCLRPGSLSGPTAHSGYLRPDQLERDLVATEQAIQLDALIDWIEAQSAVAVNP